MSDESQDLPESFPIEQHLRAIEHLIDEARRGRLSSLHAEAAYPEGREPNTVIGLNFQDGRFHAGLRRSAEEKQMGRLEHGRNFALAGVRRRERDLARQVVEERLTPEQCITYARQHLTDALKFLDDVEHPKDDGKELHARHVRAFCERVMELMERLGA